MVNRISMKEKTKLKKQQLNDIQYANDVYERENCGDFEQIYPVDLGPHAQEFQTVMASLQSTPEMRAEAQAKYQAQQLKIKTFDEIYSIVNNSEQEKAMR